MPKPVRIVSIEATQHKVTIRFWRKSSWLGEIEDSVNHYGFDTNEMLKSALAEVQALS